MARCTMDWSGGSRLALPGCVSRIIILPSSSTVIDDSLRQLAARERGPLGGGPGESRTRANHERSRPMVRRQRAGSKHVKPAHTPPPQLTRLSPQAYTYALKPSPIDAARLFCPLTTELNGLRPCQPRPVASIPPWDREVPDDVLFASVMRR